MRELRIIGWREVGGIPSSRRQNTGITLMSGPNVLMIFFLTSTMGLPVCCAQVDEYNRQRAAKILAEAHLNGPRLVTKKEVFALLNKRSIRDELNFTYKNYLTYKEIVRRANIAVDGINIQLRDIPSPKGAMYRALEAEINRKEIESIEALFEPQQLRRLNQLVHHVEIAYRGLNVALADGRLGREVGITENQKSHVRTVGQKILDEAELAVQLIRKSTHANILRLLSPEQQEEASRLLGEYFSYIDDFAQASLDANKDLRDEASLRQAEGQRPMSDEDFAKEKGIVLANDPNGDAVFLSHLGRSAIWQELKLNDDQLSAIRQIRSNRDLSGSNLAEAAREILLPEQQARLRQIGWYQEIYIRGYARAITAGFLGAALKIADSLKPQLYESISNLESQRDVGIKLVRSKAQAQLLQELSTEQQERARDLLGAHFEYVDASVVGRNDYYRAYMERAKSSR